MNHPAPSPPYLGPPVKSSGTGNKPIRRIVLHSTVSPCERGRARSTAAYFRSPSAGGSAHYCVDPGEVVQSAYDDVIAWHAPPNDGSLGVEMCEYPSQDLKRWEQPNHREMMDRTARLVAQLCLAYDVPPFYRPGYQLKAGLRGVTTHAQVSAAFRQSTHWDPGAWPRWRFMRLVRRYVKALKRERAGRTPTGRKVKVAA